MNTLPGTIISGNSLTTEQANVTSSFVALISTAKLFDDTREDYKIQFDIASNQIPLLFASDGDTGDIEIPCCTFPSLQFRNPRPDSYTASPNIVTNLHSHSHIEKRSNNTPKHSIDVSACQTQEFEASVASNLRRPMFLGQKNLKVLPATMLTNITESFFKLFDSRLRLSLSSFAKYHERVQCHSDGAGFASSILPQTLLKVFKEPDAVKPIAAVTRFCVVSGTSNETISLNSESRSTIPITLDFTIDLQIFGKVQTINIKSLGNVHVKFAQQDCSSRSRQHRPLLEVASIELDTTELLRGMMVASRSVINVAMETALTIGCDMIQSFLSREGGLRNTTKWLLSPSGHTQTDRSRELGTFFTEEDRDCSTLTADQPAYSDINDKCEKVRLSQASSFQRNLSSGTLLCKTARVLASTNSKEPEFIERASPRETNKTDQCDLGFLRNPVDGLSILSIAINGLIRPSIVEHQEKRQCESSEPTPLRLDSCKERRIGHEALSSKALCFSAPPSKFESTLRKTAVLKRSLSNNLDETKSYCSSSPKRIRYEEEKKEVTEFVPGSSREMMYCVS